MVLKNVLLIMILKIKIIIEYFCAVFYFFERQKWE